MYLHYIYVWTVTQLTIMDHDTRLIALNKGIQRAVEEAIAMKQFVEFINLPNEDLYLDYYKVSNWSDLVH